jgi:succinate dehydrogenase (ubiquinone) membrane anchor subunit
MTNLSLAALVPTAVILSPSSLNVPVDYALAVLLPLHSHIGMNGVLSDYIPKNILPLTRLALLGASGVMFLGLMNLNITGSGVTETVKTIWREPPSNKEKQ